MILWHTHFSFSSTQNLISLGLWVCGEPFSGCGPFCASLISAWLLPSPELCVYADCFATRRIFTEMNSAFTLVCGSHPLTPSRPSRTFFCMSKNLILVCGIVWVRLCLMQTTNNFITLHIVWLHNLTPDNERVYGAATHPACSLLCPWLFIPPPGWLLSNLNACMHVRLWCDTSLFRNTRHFFPQRKHSLSFRVRGINIHIWLDMRTWWLRWFCCRVCARSSIYWRAAQLFKGLKRNVLWSASRCRVRKLLLLPSELWERSQPDAHALMMRSKKVELMRWCARWRDVDYIRFSFFAQADGREIAVVVSVKSSSLACVLALPMKLVMAKSD